MRRVKAADKLDADEITTQIVSHVENSLARAPYNVDALAMYQATAMSARDLLLHKWNATQT